MYRTLSQGDTFENFDPFQVQEYNKKVKTLTVKVEIGIAKPVGKVFQAVLRPVPFFIKKASGPIRERAKIVWEFAEMAEGFTIDVKKVEADKLIRFEWPRGESKEMNTVEFRFKPFSKTVTTVFVSESGWSDSKKWREASYRNCMGWTHMICSLKAYLEYGVNLRKGAFVHMKFK